MAQQGGRQAAEEIAANALVLLGGPATPLQEIAQQVPRLQIDGNQPPNVNVNQGEMAEFGGENDGVRQQEIRRVRIDGNQPPNVNVNQGEIAQFGGENDGVRQQQIRRVRIDGNQPPNVNVNQGEMAEFGGENDGVRQQEIRRVRIDGNQPPNVNVNQGEIAQFGGENDGVRQQQIRRVRIDGNQPPNVNVNQGEMAEFGGENDGVRQQEIRRVRIDGNQLISGEATGAGDDLSETDKQQYVEIINYMNNQQKTLAEWIPLLSRFLADKMIENIQLPGEEEIKLKLTQYIQSEEKKTFLEANLSLICRSWGGQVTARNKFAIQYAKNLMLTVHAALTSNQQG